MEKKSSRKSTSKKTVAAKTAKVVKAEVKNEVVEKDVAKVEAKKSNHGTFKVLAVVILVVALLTWFIKSGTWTFDANDAGQTVANFKANEEPVRTGINELFLAGYYAINYYLVQIVFLGVLGLFYGVISKTKGYKAMVKKIAHVFKNTETLFMLFTSLAIALLGSFLTQPIVALIFVPMLYSVAKELKINKVSAMLATFGALAVGVMGVTYGTYGINYAAQNLGLEITSGISYRAVILVLGYLVLNGFIVYFNSKNKKAELVEDTFELTESDSKAEAWPYFFIFALLLIIAVLGYVSWEGSFNITFFNEIHEWLTTKLVVGEQQVPIVGQILGNITALGTWDPYTISYIMIIVLFVVAAVKRLEIKTVENIKMWKHLLVDLGILILIILAGVVITSINANTADIVVFLEILAIGLYLGIRAIKHNFISEEMIGNALSGLKKMAKPIVLITMAYTVFVLVYWSGLSNVIVDFFNKGDAFNPYLNGIGNAIADFLHVDVEYTGFALGQFYATKFANNTEQVLAVMSATSGLVTLIAPTSVFMLIGLSFSKLSYKDYFKAIWKFLLALVVVLLIVFTVITFI